MLFSLRSPDTRPALSHQIFGAFSFCLWPNEAREWSGSHRDRDEFNLFSFGSSAKKLNSIKREINHAIKQLRTNPCLWKCISDFHLDIIVCTLFHSARNSAHRESEDWMKMSDNKHKQQKVDFFHSSTDIPSHFFHPFCAFSLLLLSTKTLFN